MSKRSIILDPNNSNAIIGTRDNGEVVRYEFKRISDETLGNGTRITITEVTMPSLEIVTVTHTNAQFYKVTECGNGASVRKDFPSYRDNCPATKTEEGDIRPISAMNFWQSEAPASAMQVEKTEVAPIAEVEVAPAPVRSNLYGARAFAEQFHGQRVNGRSDAECQRVHDAERFEELMRNSGIQ